MYDADRPALEKRIKRFVGGTDEEGKVLFHDSRDRKWGPAKMAPFKSRFIKLASYRPLDRRWLYDHRLYIDFQRTALTEAWGGSNIAFYTIPYAVGAGPAAWCFGEMPDNNAFRGSYGGYAFPLFDRRAGHGAINLSPELLDALSLAYHAPVDPQVTFDPILGLLSATSYTLRFAEDLEDSFPHVPFPADRAVFERAAAVGKDIREVETFARPPAPEYLTSSVARVETTPHGPLDEIGPNSWDEGEVILCANGSGKVSGIPATVWNFSVSGYPVLPRWLAARKGVEVTHSFVEEFRDINGRINELIHRFDEADIVLGEALTHSLTRKQLGLETA